MPSTGIGEANNSASLRAVTLQRAFVKCCKNHEEQCAKADAEAKRNAQQVACSKSRHQLPRTSMPTAVTRLTAPAIVSVPSVRADADTLASECRELRTLVARTQMAAVWRLIT